MPQQFIFDVSCGCCGRSIGAAFQNNMDDRPVFCRSCIRLFGHCYIETVSDLFEDKDNTIVQQWVKEAATILYRRETLPDERWWEGAEYTNQIASDNISLDTEMKLDYTKEEPRGESLEDE